MMNFYNSLTELFDDGDDNMNLFFCIGTIDILKLFIIKFGTIILYTDRTDDH